jgi:hypothetical protein
MMGIVVEMMDAAFIIGAQDKLVAAREAIDGLHKAATAAHDTAIREMK